MEVSTFFTRLLQAPKPAVTVRAPDNPVDFDKTWIALKDTLEHPDERQLARGISATEVPRQLKHIVDALVYEGNRVDEDTTGACLEYFLRHDILAQLERLSERDRPRGVKVEVLRACNNLVVLLPERFLVHNAVHRPLRRLLRSCVGDAPIEKVDGEARILGAGATDEQDNAALEEDLVDLIPPLLLIFFHDRGWLVPHTSSGAPPPRSERAPAATLDPARALSPVPSMRTAVSAKTTGSGTSVDPTNTHFEFLLFSYLLRFVHREGRTGDFARAGLLFLFDIAFLTGEEGDGLSMTPGADGVDPLQDARNALAEYILDGDFADVMAAGLGAAYSVLPSKVRVPSLAEQAREDPALDKSGGMQLGADAEEDDFDLPSSADYEVRAQLDLLLKLFGFLQDILYRCRSPVLHADPMARTVSSTQVLGPAVADAALDAIQTAFVDNVLYPSILECSSSDGSAVAVLTYLDVLLANLEDGPVLQRILDVLMDADAAIPVFSPRTKRKHRKTGAMDYVTATAGHPEYYHSEGRFTLRDLVLDNLRASVSDASTAALHLLSTLLSDHCRRVAPTLLTVVRESSATALAPMVLSATGVETGQDALPRAVNSTDVHLQETELYGALASRLDEGVQMGIDSTAGFGSYVADAYAFLEADSCWVASRIPLQFVQDDGKPALLRVGEYEVDPLQHALSTSDAVIRQLLADLTSWFTSSPDRNVALTGTISALVRCPNRSLAGWLLYEVPEKDPWQVTDDAASDVSVGERLRAPSRDEPPARVLPALYQILRELVKQVTRFRGEVDGFGRLLAERRQGLLFADHLQEAMSAMLEPDVTTPPFSPNPSAGVPRKPSGLAVSFKNLLSPRKALSASNTARDSPVPPSPAFMAASPSPAPTTPARAPSIAAPDHNLPFKSHYAQVADVGLIETGSVANVVTGSWAKHPAVVPDLMRTPVRGGGAKLGDDDEDDDSEQADMVDAPAPRIAQATVSAVLDNCIVLEELVKELVAVIIARRALGIDQVGFV